MAHWEEIFPPHRSVFPRERNIHSFPHERITEDRPRENGRWWRRHRSSENKGTGVEPREKTIDNFTIRGRHQIKSPFLWRGLDL